MFVIDPDNFEGGRIEEIFVGGKSLGVIKSFQKGKWINCVLEKEDTASGKVRIEVRNARKGSNAIISILEWIEK